MGLPPCVVCLCFYVDHVQCCRALSSGSNVHILLYCSGNRLVRLDSHITERSLFKYTNGCGGIETKSKASLNEYAKNSTHQSLNLAVSELAVDFCFNSFCRYRVDNTYGICTYSVLYVSVHVNMFLIYAS